MKIYDKFTIESARPEYGGTVYVIQFHDPDQKPDIGSAVRLIDHPRSAVMGYRVIGQSGPRVTVKIHSS